jgi:predicted nucleotidyltransferase
MSHKLAATTIISNATLVILLALVGPWHKDTLQVAAFFNSSQEVNPLNCYEEHDITSLGPTCRPFEVYNQLEWARMPKNESFELARYCSCRLINFDWESLYDEHPATRRVFFMVKGILSMDKYKEEYPPQLWSDIDVVVNGYSIYLSTKEYFKRRKEPGVVFFKEAEFERQPHLRDLRHVCFKVATDKLHYYQYLENLQRINPVMFFSALRMNRIINLIYQSSKACKLFILHKIDEFKLKPNKKEFYAIDKASLQPSDLEDFNKIQSNNNIDLALNYLSLRLFNCRHWQELQGEISLKTLENECPMMMNDSLPAGWLEDHSEPGERSTIALKCGCQLLALNSSWVEIINDKNLDVMSKALTSYMNQNQLPNLGDRDTTTFEYFAWFDRVMEKFIKNKKISVKEIVKYKRGQDPSDVINRQTGDEEEALAMLRLGCNRLMFNHIKGSTKGDPIRPIKYLDNLRIISQDPLFVFHLTLLDANLFKLYALSKMCLPVVY